LRHELRQGEKDDALRHALFLNRFEFVELAVEHGANIGAIPFLDVLMTGDRALASALAKIDPGLLATIGPPTFNLIDQGVFDTGMVKPPAVRWSATPEEDLRYGVRG
jgi:hypothetical protein